MPAWPSTLPPFLAPGWASELPDGVRRTPMDAGPPKRRLDTTADRAKETVSMKLTAAQKDALLDFYLNDCARGALSFTLTHPVWGSLTDVAFQGPPIFSQPKPKYLATVRLEFPLAYTPPPP